MEQIVLAEEEPKAPKEETIAMELEEQQEVARIAAETKDDEQYDKLIQRWDERNENDTSLVVVETTMLKRCRLPSALLSTHSNRISASFHHSPRRSFLFSVL